MNLILFILNIYASIVQLSDQHYNLIEKGLWQVTKYQNKNNLDHFDIKIKLFLNNDGTISILGLNKKFEIEASGKIYNLSKKIVLIGNNDEKISLTKVSEFGTTDVSTTDTTTTNKETETIISANLYGVNVLSSRLNNDTYDFDSTTYGRLVLKGNSTIEHLEFFYNDGYLNDQLILTNLPLHDAGFFDEGEGPDATKGIIEASGNHYTIRFLTGRFRNYKIHFSTDNMIKYINTIPSDMYSRS